jgi:hypothetical protein
MTGMSPEKNTKENSEYDWVENNTVHHSYLLKSVINILKDVNTSNTELFK